MVLFDSTSKLLCHNVESFECADCGANLPSMRELVEHQIEFWHDSEPIIVMKSSFESNVTANSSNDNLSHEFLDLHLITPRFENSGVNLADSFGSFGETSSPDENAETLGIELPTVNQFEKMDADYDRSFTCQICGFVGENQVQVNYHLRVQHYQIRCDTCGKKFNTKSDLSHHIQAKHTSQVYLVCNICDAYRTVTKSRFSNHLRTCTGQKQNLKTAVKTMGVVDKFQKPYVVYCRIKECDTVFESSALQLALGRRRDHECKHNSVDEYECYYCKSAYRHYPDYLDHLSRCSIKFAAPKKPVQVRPVAGKYFIFI